METTDDREKLDTTIQSNGQQKNYLVLSEEERAKGYVRPVRETYTHSCGAVTSMSDALAETYARDPKFYGETFCAHCKDHYPVGEFVWDDETRVGS